VTGEFGTKRLFDRSRSLVAALLGMTGGVAALLEMTVRCHPGRKREICFYHMDASFLITTHDPQPSTHNAVFVTPFGAWPGSERKRSLDNPAVIGWRFPPTSGRNARRADTPTFVRSSSATSTSAR